MHPEDRLERASTIERVRGRTEATLCVRETRASDQRYRRMTLIVSPRSSGTVVIDWLLRRTTGRCHADVTNVLRRQQSRSARPDPVQQQRLLRTCRCRTRRASREPVVSRTSTTGGTENGMTAASSSSRRLPRFFCDFSDCASSYWRPDPDPRPQRFRHRLCRCDTESRSDRRRVRAHGELYRRGGPVEEYLRANNAGESHPEMGVTAPSVRDRSCSGEGTIRGGHFEQALAKGYLNGNWGGQGAINSLERTLPPGASTDVEPATLGRARRCRKGNRVLIASTKPR